MQPNKTTVTGLFNAPYQYQIPIFQRGYVWTLEKQVVPLWVDIQNRADARLERDAAQQSVSAGALKPLQKHFLGSLVLTPVTPPFGRVPAYEVIDGQQRSTTLQLLLLAFRQAVQNLGDEQLFKMLDALVRNPGPYTVDTDYHKIWPTQAGQDEMQLLYSAADVASVCSAYPARDGRRKVERPLMVQTFLYFYFACLAYLQGVDLAGAADFDEHTPSDELVKRIRGGNAVVPLESAGTFDAQRAQALYMALAENVQIMTLQLEAEDDPQVIFETLNARGEPLLASDLIRNFVFLQAARDGKPVSALYTKFWSQFDLAADGKGVTSNRYWVEKERQGRLTYPRIDLFFYSYTVLRSRETTLVGHVFEAFKAWWQTEHRELEQELERIVTASGYFKELVSPQGTGWLAEFARLMQALDVSIITPVYLALRERLAADSPELRQALGDLASHLTRRAVCGMTTKGYNRFFMRLLQAVTAAPDAPQAALRTALLAATADSERWPSDEIFRERWTNRPVYWEMKPARVCGILRALEYGARGPAQGSNEVPVQAALTVEHVMPQSWATVAYYQEDSMSDGQHPARDIAIHRFGNLTLLTQPLNSSVSNGPFDDWKNTKGEMVEGKRAKLGQSALLINTYFNGKYPEKWDDKAIGERSDALYAAAALVWSRPVAAEVAPKTVAHELWGGGAKKRASQDRLAESAPDVQE
ncbi:DUF262 domain-containing protein [Comamonas sp. SCN 65-56]|uniref:DUF262 domain-containing protein n=1 Tax=Comamonas sp. SCN 65-56 TaxID=1660095 RepID=UPI000AA051C2|nr:DUF262 domain-containing HNH endonuclease family protein [Comamonas sp. SCN 65-56]